MLPEMQGKAHWVTSQKGSVFFRQQHPSLKNEWEPRSSVNFFEFDMSLRGMGL
jgi:hypothetical protein